MVRLTVTDKKTVFPFFLIISLVVVIAVVIVLYLFWGFGRAEIGTVTGEEAVLPSQTSEAQKRSYQIELSGGNPEITLVVQNAAKHIALPGGKVTVATVMNADGLRQANPIFYQFASNGDKVLIYIDRAVLYSPEIDRVLDVVHFAPGATQ